MIFRAAPSLRATGCCETPATACVSARAFLFTSRFILADSFPTTRQIERPIRSNVPPPVSRNTRTGGLELAPYRVGQA